MKKWAVAIFCALSLCAFAADDDDYHLGAGDVVKVVVYDHPDLTTEVQLGKAGNLTFPLLGEVKLNGLTFSEAEELFAKKLLSGGFIKTPNVNVIVTQYRSQRVSVLGEVYKPGRYPLDGPTTLVEMLANAGGITPTGGDIVVLIHGENRTEVVLPKIMSVVNGLKDQMRVANGDTVFVPRTQQIYVYGEVNRPGNFRMEQSMSVMQALSVAGGFTLRASHSRIQIHRTKADGSVEKLSAKLADVLQPNDVVFVDESLF